ncbi:hypothetical protein ANN_08538 [Periplaneta americana]|uniref:DUF4817 domain-containing protein n=1 Tax=Periplaneta americana TaxID=6978 RepID=A0ABQ8T1P8_PERAM|nr:hypothetical protein ANN_08538 [Periplaneta americana]
MAGLCEGGNEPSGSLKAIFLRLQFNVGRHGAVPARNTTLRWVQHFRLPASASKKKPLGHVLSVPTPAIDEGDYIQRRTFAERMVEILADEVMFMSDEAHFHLNGYGFSLNEALKMIQDDQVAIPKGNNISITILSPENGCGNVTDEDSGDENNPTIDNMPGSQLRAETEVTLNTQGEGMDYYDDESHNGDDEHSKGDVLFVFFNHPSPISMLNWSVQQTTLTVQVIHETIIIVIDIVVVACTEHADPVTDPWLQKVPRRPVNPAEVLTDPRGREGDTANGE